MRTIGMASLLVAALACSTQAALDVYTTRAAWEGALGGAAPVVEDLNSVKPFIFDDGEKLTTSKLSITRDGSPNGADGVLEIEDGGNFGNIDGTTFLSGETGVTPHEIVRIDFPGGAAFAFGADFFSPFSGDGIGIEVNGELVLLDSISGFDTGFVGVVSDATFPNANIVGNPDTITFQELWSADNLSYAIVPEPAASVGIFTAMVLASLLRRRSCS